MWIVEGRVEAVSRALSRIGVESILRFEEELDPQYRVMQSIADLAGRGFAAVYGLLAGVASYRLAMPGEEWWECFGSMIYSRRKHSPPGTVEDVIGDVVWFLENCRGSIIGREAKIARVKRVGSRAQRLLALMARDPRVVIRDPLGVARSLASSLSTDYWRKTVLFAVKLAYYAARPRGSREVLAIEVPIPVDLRVACASISSGIIGGARGVEEIVSKPTLCQRAWSTVSRMSGVPPMHIDSLLWVLGKYLRGQSRERAVSEIAGLLSRVVGESEAFSLARELAWRGGC